MRSTYRPDPKSSRSELDLRELLTVLAEADYRFVVIGSSALAMHGWNVSPGDLDLMTTRAEVEPIQLALGLSSDAATPVDDGEASRIEYLTERGPVDIYVEVSGGLSFDEVRRDAVTILVGEDRLGVAVATVEHVRDMRAAVGRAAVPMEAVAPAAKPGTPLVVAIDGPAGAGKSTVSRMVARRFDFTYLNTGAMYRSVALAVLEREADPDDHDAIAQIAEAAAIDFHDEHVFLDGKDVSEAIRADDVTTVTPHIAAYPEVRAALVRRQRELFADGGYVAEGRDTGTVVAPEAPLKIYLTASIRERAERRARETGEAEAEVMDALQSRDRLDEEREMSALRIAEDAVVVDTTGRSVQDVVDEITSLAHERGVVEANPA